MAVSAKVRFQADYTVDFNIMSSCFHGQRYVFQREYEQSILKTCLAAQNSVTPGRVRPIADPPLSSPVQVVLNGLIDLVRWTQPNSRGERLRLKLQER